MQEAKVDKRAASAKSMGRSRYFCISALMRARSAVSNWTSFNTPSDTMSHSASGPPRVSASRCMASVSAGQTVASGSRMRLRASTHRSCSASSPSRSAMRAPASTRTSGMLLLPQQRAVLRVGAPGVIRAASVDDGDERLEAVEGRLARRGCRVAARRVLGYGFAHDLGFRSARRERESPDFGFRVGIKADAERHCCVLHECRTRGERRQARRTSLAQRPETGVGCRPGSCAASRP